MLNQNNNYFNYVLTYLDQGGNNIWWSANNVISSQPIAQLIINGNGIAEQCIEQECNPICSTIIESQQTTIETIENKQNLIYPTFSINEDELVIKLNNLDLITQPNYIEEGCLDTECIEEFGIWTKGLKSNNKVTVDNEIYYFIKANKDRYDFAYIYSLSLIHEDTGEEIELVKQKGILSSTIIWKEHIPTGFNPCITITKFDIEEIITTYRFVSSPYYLRSDWNVNLPWQPLENNIEEVLFSILYLLYTDLEIYNLNELVLYKDQPQQTLIETLLTTINSIEQVNSYNHSYIKNSTNIISSNPLVNNEYKELNNININPSIYSTDNYIEQESNNIITILLLLVISKINSNTTNSFINKYINICNNLNLTSLKEEVLKLIAFTEVYKITKDIYHLSLATTVIERIIKIYKIKDNHYIESLNNPIETVNSKVFGDLFEVYVSNKPINIKDYIVDNITYINNITESLYLINQEDIITKDPIHLLILKLLGVSFNNNLRSKSKLIIDVLSINNTKNIKGELLESLDLYKQEVFTNFKSYIPTDFGWLSTKTPNQDVIIKAIVKPIIDLYLHSKYIKDQFVLKDALTNLYRNSLITNTKELLPKTIQTDSSLLNSLWPGSYSNSVDLEINGYFETDIKDEINNNIKTLGVQTNLVSSIELPLVSNFNLCIDIIRLEDYRCQVDINGQLILLSNGQCDLAPPEQSIILQENTYPVTQETSTNDYFII